MIQPFFLLLIPRIHLLREVLKGFSEIFDCSEAARVVLCYVGAAESLAQDPVAGAEAFGVEGLGEDTALDLGRSVRVIDERREET